MKNTVLLFIGLCLFSTNKNVAYAEGNESVSYYLNPISKYERENLFRKYVFPHRFYVEEESQLSSNYCNEKLNELKSGSGVELISPQNVYIGAEYGSVFDEFVSCGERLSVNVDYYPKAETLGSIKKPDNTNSFYFLSSLVEVYDLSAVLGDEVFVVITEGERPVCHSENNKLCKKNMGFGERVKIVNADKCEVIDSISSMGARLSVSASAKGIAYVETDHFTAIYKIKNKVYQFVYRNNANKNEKCEQTEVSRCKSRPSRADILLREVKNTNGKISIASCAYGLLTE